MGIFFGGSGHGPESSCQISAYYKFFPGFNVFCRISTGQQGGRGSNQLNINIFCFIRRRAEQTDASPDIKNGGLGRCPHPLGDFCAPPLTSWSSPNHVYMLVFWVKISK